MEESQNNEEVKKQDETQEKKTKTKSKKKVLIIAGIIVMLILAIIGILFGGDYYDDEYEYNPETDGRYWNSEDGTAVTNKSSKKSTNQGKIYNRVALNDTQAGITAFEGLLPEGWTATIQSNWNIVSSNVPGLETVTITSPDGKASIVIDSNQAFAENPRYAEGINYDYYTTYLHYMTGDEFVQYYMDLTYGEEAVLEADLEDDSDLLQQANECTNALVEGVRASSEWMNTGNYGVQLTVSPVPATMSKRQYKVGESYLEGSCVIIAVDGSLASKYVATNNNRDWEVLYSIVFKADNKETFDKYYNDYSFIIANSQFTRDYYALVEYVSSSIVNSYAQMYAAKSQAGLDAMNSYIDSNYSSTTSESTNEKVMGMWDDYINEVDSYQTLDGGTIKTSMYNDTVAQDGDTYYIGSKTGIPDGFTELSKSY